MQYAPDRYAKYENAPLKTVGEVDYTNSIPFSAGKLPKNYYRGPSL